MSSGALAKRLGEPGTITLNEYRRYRNPPTEPEPAPVDPNVILERQARHCRACGEWTLDAVWCLWCKPRLAVGVCAHCGLPFSARNTQQLYCSMRCAESARGKPMKGAA